MDITVSFDDWSCDSRCNLRLKPRKWIVVLSYVMPRNNSLPFGGKSRGEDSANVNRANCGRLSSDFSWSQIHDLI